MMQLVAGMMGCMGFAEARPEPCLSKNAASPFWDFLETAGCAAYVPATARFRSGRASLMPRLSCVRISAIALLPDRQCLPPADVMKVTHRVHLVR